jgi:hypothetical protein
MTSQTAGSLDDLAASGQLAVPRGWRPPGLARALLGRLPREHGESLLATQAGDGLEITHEVGEPYCCVPAGQRKPLRTHFAV